MEGQLSSRKVVIKTRFRFVNYKEEIVKGIPVLEKDYFKLLVTFFEEVPGGRVLRPVLVVDRFDEVKLYEEVTVEGKKAYAEIVEGRNVFTDLAKRLRVPVVPHNGIPILFDIRIVDASRDSTTNRSLRGFENLREANPDYLKVIADTMEGVELEVIVV